MHQTQHSDAKVQPTSLPVQHILRIARQTGFYEIDKCIGTMGLLVLGKVVRQQLLETLQKLQLSETRFLALVTLYAMDPMPSNPADLAYHAETTRPSITEALNQMEAHGWIAREHIPDDRRVIHVHLTSTGRVLAATAIKQFLEKANELSEGLSKTEQRAFNSIFSRIMINTTRPQA